MRVWGIRLQVLFLALIPTLTISALLVAYFTSTRLEDLEQAFRDRGEAIALKLATVSEFGVSSKNANILENLARITIKEHQVQGVTYFNDKGEEIVSIGKISKNLLPPIKSLNRRLLIQSMSNVEAFIVPIVALKEYKRGGAERLQSEKLLGWLKIEIDTQAIHLREYEVLIHTSLILLLGLSISGLHALQMGRNVTRPILELSYAVERIKHGELTARVRTSSYPELQVLESGINTMAESLQNAQRELQAKIEKATGSLRRSLETIELQNVELEEARHKAENASQVKSEFLADMSHEIRTPLNGVVGFINLLRRTKLDEQQEDYVNIIQKSSKTLLSIINDILDFSKIEAGKLRIEKHPMNLRDCLEETLTLLVPYSAEKNLNLIPIIHPTVPLEVQGDSLRIKQVITNLVNNAIKFTEKGSVTIEIQCQSETAHKAELRVLVKDTGIGLTKEEQQQLFQAFHQVKSEHKIQGTGLGLVICKKLVEQMNGKIGLESQHGKGSTFWFTFEVGKISGQPTIHKKTKVKLQDIATPVHILAVDDNADNLKLIQYLLTELGACVTVVESGEAAIEAVRKNRFHLIFMDIRMPGMNGIEATHLIRELEHNENQSPTPIIALTAHALITEKEALLRAGIDDYLTKPIEEPQLQNIIHKWVKVSNELKVLDKKLALKLAGGKQDLADELFEKLLVMLPEDLEKIKKAFLQENWELMRDEVHKLHGAVCYCGVPKLKDSLKNLETKLAKREDLESIKSGYALLNVAIKELLEVV